MKKKVCVLGSGSSGNCTYVGSDEHGILIDAGLSAKETCRRLDEIGIDISFIKGICISHEHSDHISGARVLQKKYGIPVFTNAGTLDAMKNSPKFSLSDVRVFSNGSPFMIGDIVIEAFSVPHDAYDPVGFSITLNGSKVGIVTDMGMVTNLIRERLKGCDLLIVESNHDQALLQGADRPWTLKQRIMGRQGHLSNDRAAEVITEVASKDLQQVFLAHISKDCNRHDLALGATRNRLDQHGHDHIEVSLTYADRVSDIWAY